MANPKSGFTLAPLMKTLVIHPEDPSTTFLVQTYASLRDKTVVRGGLTKSFLRKLIDKHDRVLMMGHGSPYGLLSQDQYPDAGFYVIDESMVQELGFKTSNLYIWCFAHKFVQRHRLKGLCSEMFISEKEEGFIYGFDEIEQELIDQSNDKFAWIVSKYLQESIEILYDKLVQEYSVVAKKNPIARFNLGNLYLAHSDLIKNPNK